MPVAICDKLAQACIMQTEYSCAVSALEKTLGLTIPNGKCPQIRL